jgi:hypothetical protein
VNKAGNWATDKPRVVTKSLFDAILMKDRKSDGRLSYSTSTGWSEILCETNDLLDHPAVSKDGPRQRGFLRHARCKY